MDVFRYFPKTDVKIWYENWKKYVQVLRKLDVYLYDIKEIPNEFKKILKDYNIKIPENIDGGVFVYVPEGVKVDIPVETAYYIDNYNQKIFNVLILEKDTKLTTYTGCASVTPGKHYSITYEFLERNSNLTTVKLHLWKKDSELKAITKVYLNRANINSYYIDLFSEGKIYFKTLYYGKGNVSEKSIILSKGYNKFASEAYLEEGSVNLISKTVTFENAFVKNLQKIHAKGKIKGYIKCDGLILGNSYQETIPVLATENIDAELHHEAKVGRVSKEVLEYLESKGLSEEEATELYIRGFITDILPELDKRIQLSILSMLSKVKGL